MNAFKSFKVDELVHFNGVLIQYEALGGSNGALHCPWLVGGSIYGPSIYDSILYGRFLQLKQKYKLCNNYADEKIDKKVMGATSNGMKIFSQKPHSTWDNYFSGNAIFDWIGQNGFSFTITSRMD